jgi:hypothetical protein
MINRGDDGEFGISAGSTIEMLETPTPATPISL